MNRLAYGQQPKLENFLEQIVGPEFKLSVCDTNGLSTEGAKFKYKVFDFEADGDRNGSNQTWLMQLVTVRISLSGQPSFSKPSMV